VCIDLEAQQRLQAKVALKDAFDSEYDQTKEGARAKEEGDGADFFTALQTRSEEQAKRNAVIRRDVCRL